MKHLEGRMTQIEGADSGGNLYHKMDDQRDLEAAHALLELANIYRHFRKNGLPSLKRNHDDEGRDTEAAHVLLELANVFQHFRKNALPSSRNRDVVKMLDNRQRANRLGGDRRMDLKGERSHFLLLKANNEERKQKKRKPGDGVPFPQIEKQRNMYVREKKQEQKDNSHGMFGSSLCRKCQRCIEACGSDDRYRLCRSCFESKMAKKTLKAKSDVTYLHGPEQFSHVRSQKLIDRPTTVKKKLGLLKENARIVSSVGGKNDDLDPSMKASADDMMVFVKEPKTKKPFSFSIMHLLSAVRTALITTPSTDDYEVLSGGHLGEGNGRRNILPSLTIHEIVHHVRLQPGDPRILATKEPLQDLVRGVLKIFSSQTAPLGVNGWKALTAYGKNTKTWSWIGPVPFNLSHDHHIKEVMSPETWDIPSTTLLQLIDCFGNWLKQVQNTLKQIGSLPSPPVLLMKQTDMEERFRQLKTMKRSLSTISRSCDEVEAYFRREEALRYSIPGRAFSYTAVDGRKSTVSPLTSHDGKPSVKARDHFMLKRRRPPLFTVLSLVKDAAARLPASIGTKADICTLVRDSQFIMEGISDLQVNQVVSKALYRLHYERDPCIRYDRDFQGWVYLHGEREDGEFEDHGPCPRKKSRQVEGMQREGKVHQGGR